MRSDKLYASTIGAVILVIVIVSAMLGSFLWPYSINTWLVYFDKAPKVLWWHGLLLGFCPILGQATIPVAVITWLLMLFIG